MDNKKNVILLIVGIVLAVLICIGLISLLTDGSSNVNPTGESTLTTTGAAEETNALDATGEPTQKETTGDIEIDQTVDPSEKPVDATIGNHGNEGETGSKGETGNQVPDPTVPSENDSDITIDLQPEPTQGEDVTGGEADPEPTGSGDSKTEIDFNDF